MNILDLTITKAKIALQEKQISSVELTKGYIAQIREHDTTLNAFITVTEHEALKAAQHADNLLADGEDLPLLGIPIGLKDIFVTKGIKTTAASKVLEEYIPEYDGTVVKRLKDAGAVIVGKTNCDAWAHGSSGENSDFGPTKNPWNKTVVPGGSSSGSAAAVAANMCLAATGTDTGGSIRLPASFCNIVGLKPTYGRVSRYGVISMSSSMDTIGHFAKTVEDTALFLQVTAGNDPMDGTTPQVPVPDYTRLLGENVNGMKIAVPESYLKGVDPEIITVFTDVEKELKKLGATVIHDKEILSYSQYAVACYYIIQPAEVSSNLARFDGIRFGHDRSFFSDEAKRRIMLGTFTLSAGYYDAYYKKAMQVRTLLRQDFETAFKKYDAIITPVSPTLPWKIGEKVNDPLQMYLSDIFTVTGNLTGNPGLAVPIGFAKNLPVGMQIIGPMFSEEKLFQIGHAYERQTPWHSMQPNL